MALIDSGLYGNGVRRMALQFPTEERQQAYLADREEAYQRLAAAYRQADQPAPPRIRLSGES